MNTADLGLIREWAEQHTSIRKVYLFGSRARGDHHERSDIDLAIEMNSDDPDEAFNLWCDLMDGLELKEALSLSAAPHLEWYESSSTTARVGPGVERDGVLLYDLLAKGDT